MKYLERLGLALVFAALSIMLLLLNVGHYRLTTRSIRMSLEDSSQADAMILTSKKLLNIEYFSKFSIVKDLKIVINEANANLSSGTKEDVKTGHSLDGKDSTIGKLDSGATPNDGGGAESIDPDIITILVKNSIVGSLKQHNASFLFLVTGLLIIGSVIYSCTKYLSSHPASAITTCLKNLFLPGELQP